MAYRYRDYDSRSPSPVDFNRRRRADSDSDDPDATYGLAGRRMKNGWDEDDLRGPRGRSRDTRELPNPKSPPTRQPRPRSHSRSRSRGHSPPSRYRRRSSSAHSTYGRGGKRRPSSPRAPLQKTGEADTPKAGGIWGYLGYGAKDADKSDAPPTDRALKRRSSLPTMKGRLPPRSPTSPAPKTGGKFGIMGRWGGGGATPSSPIGRGPNSPLTGSRRPPGSAGNLRHRQGSGSGPSSTGITPRWRGGGNDNMSPSSPGRRFMEEGRGEGVRRRSSVQMRPGFGGDTNYDPSQPIHHTTLANMGHDPNAKATSGGFFSMFKSKIRPVGKAEAQRTDTWGMHGGRGASIAVAPAKKKQKKRGKFMTMCYFCCCCCIIQRLGRKGKFICAGVTLLILALIALTGYLLWPRYPTVTTISATPVSSPTSAAYFSPRVSGSILTLPMLISLTAQSDNYIPLGIRNVSVSALVKPKGSADPLVVGTGALDGSGVTLRARGLTDVPIVFALRYDLSSPLGLALAREVVRACGLGKPIILAYSAVVSISLISWLGAPPTRSGRLNTTCPYPPAAISANPDLAKLMALPDGTGAQGADTGSDAVVGSFSIPPATAAAIVGSTAVGGAAGAAGAARTVNAAGAAPVARSAAAAPRAAAAPARAATAARLPVA